MTKKLLTTKEEKRAEKSKQIKEELKVIEDESVLEIILDEVKTKMQDICETSNHLDTKSRIILTISTIGLFVTYGGMSLSYNNIDSVLLIPLCILSAMTLGSFYMAIKSVRNRAYHVNGHNMANYLRAVRAPEFRDTKWLKRYLICSYRLNSEENFEINLTKSKQINRAITSLFCTMIAIALFLCYLTVYSLFWL